MNGFKKFQIIVIFHILNINAIDNAIDGMVTQFTDSLILIDSLQ